MFVKEILLRVENFLKSQIDLESRNILASNVRNRFFLLSLLYFAEKKILLLKIENTRKSCIFLVLLNFNQTNSTKVASSNMLQDSYLATLCCSKDSTRITLQTLKHYRKVYLMQPHPVRV